MADLPFDLISLDLDHTLLNARSMVSPRNRAAVRRCCELGARAVISSGRMHSTTLAFWRDIGLDTPVISYNGALIKQEDRGEVLLHERLDADIAAELVERCQADGIQLNYYLDDVLYIAQPNQWADLYAERTTAELHPVGDLSVFAGHRPTKLLIVDTPERVAALADEMIPRYGERAYVTTSYADYLEFMPRTVDKGKSLAVVAEHFGLARGKVIAFGDALNDLPAIEWAGMGVAMANAREAIRAAAERVAPHHDEDGVAVVLEELFGL